MISTLVTSVDNCSALIQRLWTLLCLTFISFHMPLLEPLLKVAGMPLWTWFGMMNWRVGRPPAWPTIHATDTCHTRYNSAFFYSVWQYYGHVECQSRDVICLCDCVIIILFSCSGSAGVLIILIGTSCILCHVDVYLVRYMQVSQSCLFLIRCTTAPTGSR